MNSVYPWIYIDYRNNIWRFFANDDKELFYRVMYGEDKWTKDNLIDKEVLGFALYVEQDDTMHIVYNNIRGKLKYCTMKDKQWIGKTLYEIDNNEFQIQELKVEIIGSKMHIFYLLAGNENRDHGMLMHCIWSGRETQVTNLQDVILVPNLKKHYMINVDKENNIKIFFITDEGDEASLNYCSFENNKWSSSKRLYGIQGEDIGFEVLRNKQDIHILNKSREEGKYFLEHIHMDVEGNIKVFKVYESNKDLENPLIFIKDNKLYSCWIEDDKILYSIFEERKWSKIFYFDRGNELVLRRYNCLIYSEESDSIKDVGAYVANGSEFYLFVPSYNLTYKKELLTDEVNQVKEFTCKEEEIFQNLKLELSQVKLENKDLENKVEYLNMQLKKKEKSMEEYEEGFSRLLDKKKKADENYKLFVELQQNAQRELEKVNEQLLEEKKLKESFESQLKEYREENISIRQQIENINYENKRLYEELEFERNMSIMDRLLKKKSNEI